MAQALNTNNEEPEKIEKKFDSEEVMWKAKGDHVCEFVLTHKGGKK